MRGIERKHVEAFHIRVQRLQVGERTGETDGRRDYITGNEDEIKEEVIRA